MRQSQELSENFIKLFEPIEPDLYRIAYVYLKNRDDALDCVQDAAVRCYRGFKRLREPGYFKTWAVRVTVNCAKDILKKQVKTVPFEELPECPEPDGDTEKQVLERLTLEELLNELSENERMSLILHFGMEYGFKEIAEIMDIPLGTAKSLCYRGMEKLRRRYFE